MTRLTRGTLLVAAIMLLAGTPARAQIVNGSFEFDYAGWTLEESPPMDPCTGTWGIATTGLTLSLGGVAFDFNDGLGCDQNSPGLPITFTPTDGNKLAFQLQTAPQFHRMYQDVDVGQPSTLHWDMQYLNHCPADRCPAGFDPAEQYLAVRIRDSSSDEILETLFITNPGDPQSNPDHPLLTHFSKDLTVSKDLTAHAGMKVRLSVEVQASRAQLDAQFDNFRLAPNNTCTPPSIASVTATPSVIWPPNHKMVLVTVSVDASAVCGPPVCRIVAIASDEPSNGPGDGNTSPDARIVSDFTAEVRAVRAGGSLGRTYTITVECTDTAGSTTTKVTQVFVPHDRRE